MAEVKCQGCGESRPSFDIISVGSADSEYRQLCSRCFNNEMAERSGLECFENVRFEPVQIDDCTGQSHEFHFQTRLLGDIVALDAFELDDGVPAGYEFQVIGDPDEDMFGLLGRMIQKIRRALAVKFLEDGEYGLQIAGETVKGTIECDLSEVERTPLMLIDGREVSWEEFGRLLMSFEGWQFKLAIFDSSQEP